MDRVKPKARGVARQTVKLDAKMRIAVPATTDLSKCRTPAKLDGPAHQKESAVFAKLLTLDDLGGGEFQAPAAPDKGDTLFGGQFIAQCLAAAETTVANDRQVHSLHAYFLRPGDVDLPSTIGVVAVRDGRSFSWRQTVVRQRGKELFRMLASYQVPVESPEFTSRRPPDTPPPERVSVTYDEFTMRELGQDNWYGTERPMEIRYVNPPSAPRGEPITESQLMWMRINERLPDAPAIHQAGLAYLSDATLVDHVMLPHGLRWQDADFEGTSLDHAMWFHRFARADEWLLFEQTVESTGAGRGLARGYFFDRGGVLIATCMQEGLMRWKSGGDAI